MTRSMHKLTARTVATVKDAGRYSDGDGLYLRVGRSNDKRWVFRYTSPSSKKPREMGLGSARTGMVSLGEARALALKARETLQSGQDPLEQRSLALRKQQKTPTFGEFSDQFVDEQVTAFRNAKHIAQWRMTLREYAAPIRQKQLDAITTEDILSILQPIWRTKSETADRLRGRIERVLNAAKARGLRSGENPAAWRGHLELILPKREKLTRGHFAAMPYGDVPKFMQNLRVQKGTAARALEFLILSACRSGEVRQMQWCELDLQNDIWNIPAARMKMGREHRVPITERMNELLTEAQEQDCKTDYVFVGPVKQNPFSDAALSAVLKRMEVANCTVHGFRSSFRDWAGDMTDAPREVAEAALAHVVGDATERAYRRGDAFEKRSDLMKLWSGYCDSDGAFGYDQRQQAAQ